MPAFDWLAAQRKMVPVPRAMERPPDLGPGARVGAVLLMVYERDGRAHVVLTRRLDTLRHHAGQISLPGGRREDGESLQGAALREAWEEIGIAPEALQVLGQLNTLYIQPSDYQVHPFVAWHPGPPVFRIDPREVAEIIETPLSLLLDPATRIEEVWTRRGIEMLVPYFAVQGHKVWGATAMILSEFIERLRALPTGRESGIGNKE